MKARRLLRFRRIVEVLVLSAFENDFLPFLLLSRLVCSSYSIIIVLFMPSSGVVALLLFNRYRLIHISFHTYSFFFVSLTEA